MIWKMEDEDGGCDIYVYNFLIVLPQSSNPRFEFFISNRSMVQE